MLLLAALSALAEGLGLLVVVPLVYSVFSQVGVELPNHSETTEALVSVPQIFATSIPSALFVLSFAIAARIVLQLAFNVAAQKLRFDMAHILRTRVFSSIASSNWEVFNSHNNSKFVHASTYLVGGVTEGYLAVIRSAGAFVLASSGLFVGLLFAPTTTMGALLAVLLLNIPLIYFDRRSISFGRRSAVRMEHLYNRLENYVGGLKALRAQSLQNTAQSQFVAASGEYAISVKRAAYNHILASGAARALAGFALITVLIIIANYGSPDFEVVIVMLVFFRVLPNLQTLHSQLRQGLEHSADFRAFDELLNEIRNQSGSDTHVHAVRDLGEELIQLEGVGFYYDLRKEKSILRAVNLSISEGESIGVIGPSGAGKTTLVDIISGLLLPKSGSMNIAESVGENISDWRKCVAYAGQEEFIYSGSVRENFTLARPGISDAEIQQLLQLVDAHTFMSQLPDGLNTEMGERGTRLSRGQRQRLCLARSLVGEFRILILDEATSALPPMDEKKILNRLKLAFPERALLVVSHRFTSLATMKRLLIVDGDNVTDVNPASGIEAVDTTYIREIVADHRSAT